VKSETKLLYIEPAQIVTPGGLLHGAVLVDGDRVRAVGPRESLPCPPGARRIAASGLLLAPGFIDLQLNGGFGMDFTADPSSIWNVAAKLPRYGVTSFLPTVITSPASTISRAQRVLREGRPARFTGAEPLGLHLEGPFLNPQKRGAHNPAYLLLPDMALADGWSPESGVSMVTLAPELPGALDLARALAKRGVVVSAGHSMATYDEAYAGFQAGITYGTHLFNAMSPLDHRAPGLPGALLGNLNATTGIIPDGIHVHPALVAMAFRLKGTRRLSVVTDAMAALGMPPGVYRLGDREVTVGADARLSDGTLAGSLISLDAAVRNLWRFAGCSPEDALATVTEMPASVLGLRDRGRIEEGGIADLVLLNSELDVMTTIVRGEVVFSHM
jgi:N-acetylglucosamine-6-phosphate deacetylase